MLGYLTGNSAYVYEGFVTAYHWMMEQMKKRIPHYVGSNRSVTVPVALNVRHKRDHKQFA